MCGLCVELVAVENDLLEACMLSSLSLNTRCTTANCPRGFGCKGPSHLSAITPQSQCNQGFRGPFPVLFCNRFIYLWWFLQLDKAQTLWSSYLAEIFGRNKTGFKRDVLHRFTKTERKYKYFAFTLTLNMSTHTHTHTTWFGHTFEKEGYAIDFPT